MAEPGNKRFWTSPLVLAIIAGGFGILAAATPVILPRVFGADSSGGATPTTARNKLQGYYTEDGSTPALGPNCVGIFTLCLGASLTEATTLLGTEQARFGTPGHVGRRWDIAGSSIVVDSDRVGTIIGLGASLNDPATDFRLNIPGPLTLGSATMGDVLRARGEPSRQDTEPQDVGALYAYVYCTGAELGTKLSYFLKIPPGASDPGGFNSSLDSMKVTSFYAEYALCIPNR